jgi:hypothetical protein
MRSLPFAHTESARAGGSGPAVGPGPQRAAASGHGSAHFTVIGNPGSRRVNLFRDAVLAAGAPEPTVIAWRDVLHATGGATPGHAPPDHARHATPDHPGADGHATHPASPRTHDTGDHATLNHRTAIDPTGNHATPSHRTPNHRTPNDRAPNDRTAGARTAAHGTASDPAAIGLAASGPRGISLAAERVRGMLREAVGRAGSGGTLVRVESPGEDEEVDRLLRGEALGRGWEAARVEGGEAWYGRFTAATRTLADAAAGVPGCVLLADPAEIAVMFDKRLTHARLAAGGVPVPRTLDQGEGRVSGWEELRERLTRARMPRVFVKPAHGSSASGVVALEFGPGGRAAATTSAELGEAADGGTALFNSLRVRRYTREAELRALFDVLAREPLHVEQWLPKATQQGRSVDLRVVVTAGRATHAVVRTSRHPMTNLHLGGARGDLAALREVAGPAWLDVLETCERTARLFPASLGVGIDVLPAIGWRAHAVGEVNAFGDLLPGLTGLPGSGAEGMDTYGAFTAAALRGHATAAATEATSRLPEGTQT